MNTEFDDPGTAIERTAPTYVEQNASMVQQYATARIQSAYTMALRSPRIIDVVRDEVLRECRRPSFCAPDESKNGSSLAIYRVPRGSVKGDDGKWVKQNIQGPTIRFAEMMLRSWKYLSVEVNPMGEDDNQRLLQVVCTDYQSCNFTSEMVSVPKRVERKTTKSGDVVVGERINSYGDKVFLVIATDDELAMKTNALVSKARRNLILQAVPGWLIEEAIDEVRKTAAKKDAEDPDAAKRRLFDAFSSVGVTAAQLADYLGHGSQLSPAELEDLRGYFSGIREGMTTWAAIVAAKEDATESDGSAEKIEALLTKLEKTPAQVRTIKAKYIGNPKALIEWMEKEVAKKANDGGAKVETAKATEAKPEQKKEEQTKKPEPEPQPEPEAENLDAEPEPEPSPIKQQQAPKKEEPKKTAPPVPQGEDNW